jgi:hypothetical protein
MGTIARLSRAGCVLPRVVVWARPPPTTLMYLSLESAIRLRYSRSGIAHRRTPIYARR